MPPFGVIVMRMSLAAIALTILALIATNDMRLTFGFIGGALGALILLALLGEGVMRLMKRLPSPRYVPARLSPICDYKTRLAVTCDYHCLRSWLICVGRCHINTS